MYKIAEFAKITGLPSTTLHYYDKENILKPSLRDKDTNYRYYSEKEYEKATFLTLLRQNQFSIAEIKDIFLTITDFSDISYYLIEKKKLLQTEVGNIENQIETLDSLISEVEAQPLEQNYKIQEVHIPVTPYIYRHYSGDYNEMGPVVNELYQEGKNQVAGPLFMLDEFLDESASCQLGLPIKNLKTKKVLPKQKGIQIQHRGSYGNIGQSYKYLIDYAHQANLATNELFFVQFTKGPGKLFKGNINSYLTEVTLLLNN